MPIKHSRRPCIHARGDIAVPTAPDRRQQDDTTPPCATQRSNTGPTTSPEEAADDYVMQTAMESRRGHGVDH
jgi:hypothetical protein